MVEMGANRTPRPEGSTVHFYEHSRHFIVMAASSVDEVRGHQLMCLSNSYEHASRSTLTL